MCVSLDDLMRDVQFARDADVFIHPPIPTTCSVYRAEEEKINISSAFTTIAGEKNLISLRFIYDHN